MKKYIDAQAAASGGVHAGPAPHVDPRFIPQLIMSRSELPGVSYPKRSRFKMPPTICDLWFPGQQAKGVAWRRTRFSEGQPGGFWKRGDSGGGRGRRPGPRLLMSIPCLSEVATYTELGVGGAKFAQVLCSFLLGL